MGKIYQFHGYIFFFYSNDHLPIHVHVKLGDCEVKIEFVEFQGTISLNIKQLSKKKFSRTQMNEIEEFCRTYSKEIIKKWEQVFIHRKKAKFEEITFTKKKKGK
jgi:hypothetical protein